MFLSTMYAPCNVIQSFLLLKTAAVQKVTPAARLSSLQAGIDTKPDGRVIVGMLCASGSTHKKKRRGRGPP